MATLLTRSLLLRNNSCVKSMLFRQYSSAAVRLAFTRHDAPLGLSIPASDSPLVVMHGLFGSKQNNRSISK
jgi:hypothetical protein